MYVTNKHENLLKLLYLSEIDNFLSWISNPFKDDEKLFYTNYYLLNTFKYTRI